MRLRPGRITLLGLGIVALVAGLWGAIAWLTRPEPLHIAFPAPLSGPLAYIGEESRRAAQLYLDDVNAAGGSDPATTVFTKGSRYDKMMEAFGGAGIQATTPDELKRAVDAAMDSGKPTLINAVIDPAAGSESGRIGNLNPQSKIGKKA